MIEFPAFRPHPLLRSGHAQTIVGSLAPGRRLEYGAQRHFVPLDDGDAIVLHDDAPPAWRPADRVALLVHGLCGSHLSPYVARTASKLNAQGVRTFRMDLRSHGAGLDRAQRIGHAGRSEDLAAALRMVLALAPQASVHLVGFSMGANIVLKLAGELGANPPANLAGVFAAAPPVDLHFCCDHLRRGWNWIYDGAFTRNLNRHFRAWQTANPQLELPRSPTKLKRIFDFDEHITAPHSGYRDAAHYYAEASSGPLLTEIAVPTVILAAADDPIVPICCLEKVARSPQTQLIITEHGGHLGYIGARSADADSRWLDWRIVDWVLAERVKPARPVLAQLFEMPALPILAPATCRSA
jgi:predicted alpha/beta-fold hydrolase